MLLLNAVVLLDAELLPSPELLVDVKVLLDAELPPGRELMALDSKLLVDPELLDVRLMLTVELPAPPSNPPPGTYVSNVDGLTTSDPHFPVVGMQV
jgi:hypothetical protein